jgi:uncharacterized protein (DUF362 family)
MATIGKIDGAHVSIARLPGGVGARAPESVYRITRQALDLLGGMQRFVKPRQTALIKPNQTVFLLAENGVTTDPWVVAAIARLVLEAGGRPLIGDMPGAGITSKEVISITGMDDAVRRVGAEVVYLDEMPQKPLPVPNGQIVQEIELPAAVVDADVLINVPKAKTHFVDPISGALKNWMGAMRPDIRMRHHDRETPQYVLDATMARPPHLHVMDALWAGEGRGPIGNTPAWVGCVLASTDPVVLDVTTARLLGFSDEQAISMTYAREAVSRGLGTADLMHVEVLGESLDAVRTPIRLYRGGTPTIMIGRAEDPDFEQHLAEGPYVTIDDVVEDRYKRHPSIQHIPGHPVCDQMYRELIRALGVKLLGTTAMELMKVFTNLRSELKY